MPAGIETFGNQPTGTVTAGGTTTSDTSFTVTATDTWPAASSSVTPNTFFRIVDAANTSEIMIVTTAPGGSGSGQSWTVQRGAEGTTAISHSSNWTAVQVVSAGTLQNFKQASNAVTTPVTVASSTTETVIASYTPVALDIEAGATFEAVAFGTIGWQVKAVQTWRLRWGGLAGTLLCSLVTGTTAPTPTNTTSATGATFDVNGTVTLIDSTHAASNLNLFYNGGALTVAALNATTAANSTVISGGGPLVLTFQWTANSANNTVTASAPLIYRAA